MARLFASLVVGLLVVEALADPFGRFGYGYRPDIPGFKFSDEGFRVDMPASDLFRFPSPNKTWRPLATTEMSQTCGLTGKALSPEKFRQDLLGTGFWLYYRYGFSFKLGSIGAPYLSWKGASVGAGKYATPAEKWILVSFRDRQPAVLLSFPDTPCAVRISGKSGDWSVESDGQFDGWVHVSAPFGVTPTPTNDAATLGDITTKVTANESFWSAPTPKLVDRKIEDDSTSVTVTWTFDRPGAVLPMPIIMAPIGGDNIKVLSKTRRIDGFTPQGPITVCDEPLLKVRFVVHRIPTGRSICVGQPTGAAIGTASPYDIPSVVALALANLQASRDKVTRDGAEETYASYIGDVPTDLEPATGQKLPFAPSGKGMDLVAANALLMQTTLSTVRATSDPNSLLTSLAWRLDWYTWKLWAADDAVVRRAQALAAIASSLCPEPERRLQAAMMQAGLSAERGLGIWQRRNKLIAKEPALLEVMEPLRKELFNLDFAPKTPGIGQSLQSELRGFGDVPLVLEKRDNKLILSWQSSTIEPIVFTLASAYPITLAKSKNLDLLEASAALGFTVVKATATVKGTCEAELTVPEWAAPLPAWMPVPEYSELSR